MKITAKSEGSTKVKVKAKNNKTYTVSVKVKPVLNSKTFSTAPGKRVTVKVQGGIVKSAKHLSGDGSSEITKKSSKSVTLTATGEAGKDKFSITTKKGTTLKFSVTVNSSQSGDTGQSSDTAQTSDTQRGLNDESSFGTGTITKTFSYEFATSSHKTEGVNTKELTTGQSSDVTLLSYDVQTADEYHLYHPNGMAYYYDDINQKQYYFVADTWNNRVLVFRCEKNDKLNENTPIYAVLGQKSKTSSKCGASLSEMNFPINVAVVDLDGKTSSSVRIYVADSNNSRILVYDKIPAGDGVSADFQLCYSSSEKTNETLINWPWGVYADSERLMVCSTRDGKILVWDTHPDSQTDYPDTIIRTGGTPRCISFDKEGNVLIADHNIGEAAGQNGSITGTRIIKKANFENLLSKKGEQSYLYDYLISGQNGMGQVGTCLISGKIPALSGALVAYSGWDGLLHIYKDGVIDSETDAGDYTIWSSIKDTDVGFYSWSGDLNSVIQDINGNVYAVSYNGNKVIGYTANTFPTSKGKADVMPDLSWGVKSKSGGETLAVNTNVTDEMDMLQNCRIDVRGNYLVTCDDFNETFAIYKGIPDETGAIPDVIVEYHQNGTDMSITRQDFNDVCLFDSDDGKMGFIVGGTQSINVWYDIEDVFDKKDPDLNIRDKIGNISFSSEEIKTFDYDGTYLYVGGREKIYIFEGFPESNEKPVATINCTASRTQPAQINVTTCPDGSKYLVDASGFKSPVIYDISSVNNITTIGSISGKHGEFKQFNGCFDAFVTPGRSVVAIDAGFSHIDVWESISAATSDGTPSAIIGLGGDNYTAKDIDGGRPDIDPLSINAPTTLNYTYLACYDEKGYLWTGAFKFAGGIRRFTGTIK